MYTHRQTHTDIHRQTHKYTQTDRHTHTDTHTQIYTDRQTNTHTHSQLHVSVHVDLTIITLLNGNFVLPCRHTYTLSSMGVSIILRCLIILNSSLAVLKRKP